jgi:photosystem II stability/assembly factor-like uncharacterized protein
VTGWNGWASLGGQLAGGDVTAVRNIDGRLELFGQIGGAQGPEVAHVWQTSPNNGWSTWASLGPPPAQFLGAMTATANTDGRLEVFGRVGLMSTGALFHIWQTAAGNGWSTWASLGGGMGPQFLLVVTNADGRLEVFAVGTGPGQLEHIWQTSPGGGWSGWDVLGTLPGGFPVQLTAGVNADGRLELFNVGTGGLWHNWQTAPGAGWAGWSGLGTPAGVSTLSGVAVGRNADGRLEVFTTGQNALWHIYQTTPNGGWSAWDNLGNPGVAALDAPSVGTNADGRLEVFIAGLDDALFHIYQTSPSNGWSAWDTLGGEPAQPVAVGLNADGRMEIFAVGRATPGQVWHRWQTASGAWSDISQDWQQTSLAGPAHQLFVTTNDAVLARTDAGLFRSQDGGTTWNQLGLPASWGVVAVDPTAGGQILYVATPTGLQKSVNAGASWSLVLPVSSTKIIGVAISPANASVVYVAIGEGAGSYSLQRSTNGGTTWTVLQSFPHGDLCTWSCFILQGHPLDAQRAFQNIACVAGRNVPGGLALQRTTDQGITWTDVFHPVGLYPVRLVGGWGANTQRWYVGAYLAASPGGGTYYRSDDDAATWSPVLTLAAGESVGGLAYHPSAPDRVYVGVTTGTVRTSTDAGSTWTNVGTAALGALQDLALSQDQGVLFAASNTGVWRYFV